MTEDVQIGGDADQKLQSQLYIGKTTCVSVLSQAVQQLRSYSSYAGWPLDLCLIKLYRNAQEVRRNNVDF